MARRTIEGQRLAGERAAFGVQGADITEAIFAEGESPLKHSGDIAATRTIFEWKYPLWYAKDVTLDDSALLDTARSGPWYAEDMTVRRTLVAAPKTFRRCRRLVLEDVAMPQADETLWNCEDVQLTRVDAQGNYFGMGSSHVRADGLRLTGNYVFDGGSDIEVSHSTLLSKDAFWNCHDVVVRDSLIVGEYLGWNSRNVTFIDCVIESLQGLCYIDNLVMRGCRLINTTLAFEYSTVDVDIVGSVDSVINPSGGVIKASAIGELILDPDRVDVNATRIITES
jgi:hypothetical protein